MIHTVHLHFHWAHLQPPHWVDEGDGNDGQTECQYNDGKETKRSVASSEAPDIAIDVPPLQSTMQRRKINKREWDHTIRDRDFQSTLCNRYSIHKIHFTWMLRII